MRWSAAACTGRVGWPGTPSRATGSRAGSWRTGARNRSPAARELPGRVLRHRRRHRLQCRDARARRSGPVTGMTLIHDRPAEALERVEPSHPDGDLVMGPATRRRPSPSSSARPGTRCSGTCLAPDTTRVCFCDPHSPWQRPTNENTNGILRDYFPKGTDLSVQTADDIALVQHELNRRPRKIFGWDDPADRLATLLRSSSGSRR